MNTIGPGDLIDRSVQFYRLHKAKTLTVVAMNAAAGLVAVGVETAMSRYYPDGSAISIAATIAATAFALAVNVLAYVMLARLVAGEVSGAATLAPWVKGSLGAFWPTAAAILGSGALVFLGLVAFVLPGVVFWIWFAFAPVVAALGEEPWSRSFAASREVSSGRFLRTAWRLLAPLVFFSLLQLVAVLVTILVLQGGVRGIWTIELMAAGAPLWFLLLVNSATEIVRDLISPLFIIVVTLLFLSLRHGEGAAASEPKKL